MPLSSTVRGISPAVIICENEGWAKKTKNARVRIFFIEKMD
jgi:hypothetical protein